MKEKREIAEDLIALMAERGLQHCAYERKLEEEIKELKDQIMMMCDRFGIQICAYCGKMFLGGHECEANTQKGH